MEDKRTRRILLHSLCSWTSSMALNGVALTDKEGNKIPFKSRTKMEQLFFNVDRFYKKRKIDTVSQLEEKILSKKLDEIKEAYENAIVLNSDRYLIKGDRTQDVKTVEYSPALLAIVVLDYMIKVEEDLEIRRKFGHIRTTKLLSAIEESIPDLCYSTYRIFNTLEEKIRWVSNKH